MVREVVHVQAEGTVGRHLDQLPYLVDEAGLTVGRHAHHLVLPFVHLESEECGEYAVEEAERMRKANLAKQLQLFAIADTEARGRPLPHAVHGEDRRLVEARRIEGAGGV